MLTKLVIDGRKLLCSNATPAELREMYEEVKAQNVLAPQTARPDDPKAAFFHYEFVGPADVHYKDRRYILWGSAQELRFYTPEEYEVLQEG